jgi:cell division protein FtsI (penicillin-binding protein 3)
MFVKRGTGTKLYSKDFFFDVQEKLETTPGKLEQWQENKHYISSFVGFFPAENPKYSCIVVVP